MQSEAATTRIENHTVLVFPYETTIDEILETN
jgi:hypothetical protein